MTSCLKLLQALEKSIKRHKSLIATLELNLADTKLSKTNRNFMTTELNRNKAILSARYEQQHEMMEVDKPNTAAVDRDEADDLQKALADATTDLRRDFETIFVKYGELNRERNKVFKVKADLEARKKWLSDHAKNGE